jgi:hypothetical protein
MMRIAILIALLISLLTLTRFGLRLIEPPPASGPPPIKQEVAAASPIEPETTKPSYYPVVPQPLPDLNTGYLFTETRSVAGEGEGPGTKGGLEKIGEPEVDIYAVVYIGSIITSNLRKAIISAPPPKDGQQKAAVGKPGRTAASRRATAAQARAQAYVRVTQGELFRGYMVKLISPDKIVFERGEEMVERLLYDPAKKRAAGPPVFRGPSAPVATPPPTPERPILAEPPESRQMVVGGPDNIVAEPQQPAAIIRRAPRPAAPADNGEQQPQGVLLERPPR